MELILETQIIAVHQLRCDAGEEAISAIEKYCKDNRITAGKVSIIGACTGVTLLYYNPTEKKYEPFVINDSISMEVLPCEGNIGVFENEPIVHIHGSFGDNTFAAAHGGHVDKLIAGATLEVTIQVYKGTLQREFDENTCLKLLVKN